LFPGTIYENLTYGIEEADEARVKDAAKRAMIHEVINALPDGYHTHLGNRGAVLSGGERQRIAIARALLRKPAIIILDEPDNNLGASMTRTILENIKDTGATIFIISHNPDMLEHSDQRLHVQDGTITIL
jgi:ABC-type multidrug transport system fused ATPase/permease subunit